MKVVTEAINADKYITLEGAHSVSWAYLLDLIYADAYHREVKDLRFFIGNPELTNPIQLRAEVTRAKGDGGGIAIAQLVTLGSDGSEVDADVIYTVEYGLLSTRALRMHNPPEPEERILVKQYSVFTWKARFLGIPIRLAGMCNQPHLFDRFMKKMRSVFLCDAEVPAYYHLKIWAKTQTL